VTKIHFLKFFFQIINHVANYFLSGQSANVLGKFGKGFEVLTILYLPVITLNNLNMRKVFLTVAVVGLTLSCEKTMTKDNQSLAETSFYSGSNVSDSIEEQYTNVEVEETTIQDAADTQQTTNDIDVMLDDYEKYVDQYIVFANKIGKSTDMSIMSEYPALMEKGQQWANSMENSQDEKEFSPAQMKRMLDIQNKMTVATSKIKLN